MPHLGEAELGALAGDHEVAPRHQREPVAEAVAVHRRDDRLEDLPAALERVDGRLLPERAARTRRSTRAPSRRSAPAQNAVPAPVTIADPGVLVVAEAAERVVEVAAHVAVDRVERLGPVVRDRRDVAVELVENGFTHREVRPPSRAGAARAATGASTRRLRCSGRSRPVGPAMRSAICRSTSSSP